VTSAAAGGRRALGYGLVIAAVTMWSLNASIARSLLDGGIDAFRLSELRALGAWLVLVAVALVVRPAGLRAAAADARRFAVIGIAGFAAVYVTYFVAIDRLQIGAALTLQYLAPILLLVWLAVLHRRRLPRSLWGAALVSLAGCVLVVRAYDPGSLDALGVAAGLGAAFAYATYLAGSEQAGRRHHPLVTLVWSFGFGALFWLVVQPPWTFPFGELGSARDLWLAAAVVVVGTVLPFGCAVAALRHVPAARAAVVATLEPALSALFAFLIHDEGLAAIQVGGGALVLAAVVWVQLQDPDAAAEAAPGGDLVSAAARPD
jgi:drug/metabolite transporter (DMT)-like permease